MMRTTKMMALAAGLAVAAGCGSRKAANAVTIKGSDTMVILVQRWAEGYMKVHPGAVVQVTGGGSGTGIAALINGGTDICTASRPMKPEEFEQVKAKRQAEAREIPVALDGIAVYVHEKSRVKSLTLDQIKQIYQGKIADWKALGGTKGPIIAYSRENNSGTYEYFKEHVLAREDFAANVQSMPGTAAIVNAVAKDPQSIGYGGIAYAKGVRPIAVSPRKGRPAVAPSQASVVSGKYPISRKLYFYTAGEPAGLAGEFVTWALSDEGQKICQEVGYFPLKTAKKPAPVKKSVKKKK
jgi:phosphate transport system substrate-binding protein